MSEIKDLEQAFFILEHGSSEGVSKYLKAILMIKEQCVQVVRCKDCRYFVRSEGICKLLSNNYEPPVYVDDDDFCSHGERKEE